jgi:hypothetical protein
VFSARHEELIARLDAQRGATWLDEALGSCLRRLRDGGPTEWRSITVVDAWTDGDAISVVYRWNTMHETFGCRVGRHAPSDEMTAAEYGIEIADFHIAEPLGTVYDSLRFDANGIGWWGYLPEEAA